MCLKRWDKCVVAPRHGTLRPPRVAFLWSLTPDSILSQAVVRWRDGFGLRTWPRGLSWKVEYSVFW